MCQNAKACKGKVVVVTCHSNPILAFSNCGQKNINKQANVLSVQCFARCENAKLSYLQSFLSTLKLKQGNAT